jgi:NTP pyrophosphatase (non-canonical NTP hydrolase)
MQELIEKIEQWAEDRNIIAGATPRKQAEKTMEECLELLDAVTNNDLPEVVDAIGDIVVTLVIQARMQGIDFVECVESAYNVIKDRKGKLIDGKFVKE